MRNRIRKIIIILLVILVIVICISIIKKDNNIENYKQIAEYVFELKDAEGEWQYFSSEQQFIVKCKSESVKKILEDVHIESMRTIGNDIVLIIEKHCWWGLRGYVIVRNDVVLPNEQVNSLYEQAKYEYVDEGVYRFKWINIPN